MGSHSRKEVADDTLAPLLHVDPLRILVELCARAYLPELLFLPVVAVPPREGAAEGVLVRGGGRWVRDGGGEGGEEEGEECEEEWEAHFGGARLVVGVGMVDDGCGEGRSEKDEETVTLCILERASGER